MAVVELIYDVKPYSYITSNPTKILSNGEPIYLSDGRYGFGDGITTLSSLPLYGGSGYAFTGLTSQYTRGDGSYATFPTNVSSFTNDSGYITSSALSPYLTSATAASTYLTIANAASTYQPIGSYLTGLTVGSTAIGSGTNTRILYNNAGVLGEYAVTGTGTTAVLSNSPTFTTQINVNGLLNIIRTSEQLRVGYDTSNYVSYTVNSSGDLTVASSSAAAVYTINNTVSINNVGYDNKLQFSRTGGNGYSFQHDTASLYLYNNTASKAIFRAFNGGYTIFDTPVASTGSNVQYQFTSANSTGHTTGANIPNFRLLSATKTWSAGALTNQYFVHLASQTIAFASASTAANVYGLYVEAATAGTNATITNNYALGLSGDLSLEGGNRIIRGSNSIEIIHGQGSNYRVYTGSTLRVDRNPTSVSYYNGIATSGSVVGYLFTSSSNTGQTASAEIPSFKLVNGTRTWAAGAITTQREFYITSPTYAFASASTITNAYGAYFEAPTAGTNATITNNYAAGFGGNVICTGFFRSGTYVYAENDFRIAGAVVLDYSSTTLQVATSSFFQSLSLRTNGVTRLALSTTDLTFSDSYNLIFNATTGTKIGTATTQKLAFWNATPIVQPTTAVAAATFVANTSAIANDTATFDGYTIGQIVKALRNAGLLA